MSTRWSRSATAWEKIKAIGDSFMATSGLLAPSEQRVSSGEAWAPSTDGATGISLREIDVK